MKNILTIDVEDWYHANYDGNTTPTQRTQERVTEPTLRILQLLEDTNNKATFFVLGEVAEQLPDLVKYISDKGHEIASHSYHHKLVYTLNEKDFRHDTQKSKAVLEDIIGKEIKGYRAPSWSLCLKKTPWSFKILKSLGFQYDSSLFPFKTFLYGDNTIPPSHFKVKISEGQELDEIPPSLLKFGSLRFPFSGGFYFRATPFMVTKLAINILNKREIPAIIYLHPREIDKKQPRLRLNLQNSIIHYFNINGTEQKFNKLLTNYTFTTINDFYFNI